MHNAGAPKGEVGTRHYRQKPAAVLQAGRVQSGTEVRQSFVVASSSLVQLLLGPSERPPPTHCDRSEVSPFFTVTSDNNVFSSLVLRHNSNMPL